MSWTAGEDVSTGQLITAARWNNYLGATGSLEYLKTEVDKLDDVSWSEPSRALDTIYQNTSGKLLFVSIGIELINTELARFKLGSATPPTTTIADAYNTITGTMVQTVAFIVPPSYYYKAEIGSGTPTIDEWHEWVLH